MLETRILIHEHEKVYQLCDPQASLSLLLLLKGRDGNRPPDRTGLAVRPAQAGFFSTTYCEFIELNFSNRVYKIRHFTDRKRLI